MRAARLLRILLLLQNRGRMSTARLAEELEVARRTVMRDIDALTEAGLPVVVLRGAQGGVELGFNYRTRLTGLDAEEAEALGLILAQPAAALSALGLGAAAVRAHRKLIESLPDTVRQRAVRSTGMFQLDGSRPPEPPDPRIPALAAAIRARNIVRIGAFAAARTVHPVRLQLQAGRWLLTDGLAPEPPIDIASSGDLNISRLQF